MDVPSDSLTVLEKLLSDPTIASKRWVYRQYDQMVRSNTLIRPGSDAAVIRVKGTPLGLAMTIDGIGSYCALDPFEGAKIVVAESARNIACSGAEPVGMTDCLNFGNPEKPEVFYYFDRVIAGLGEAGGFLISPLPAETSRWTTRTLPGPSTPPPSWG